MSKEVKDRVNQYLFSEDDTTSEQEEHTTEESPTDNAAADSEQPSQAPASYAQLEQQYKAMAGRVKPLQHELAQVKRENRQLQRSLADKDKYISQLEEELDGLTDVRIEKNVIQRREKIMEKYPHMDMENVEAMAYMMEEENFNRQKQVRKQPQQTEQSNEAQEDLNDRKRELLNDSTRRIGSLQALLNSPEFNLWAAENPLMEKTVSAFVNTTNSQEVEQLADTIDHLIDTFYLKQSAKSSSAKEPPENETEKAEPQTSTPVRNRSMSDFLDRKQKPMTVTARKYEERKRYLRGIIRSGNQKQRDEAIQELDALHEAYLKAQHNQQ